MIIFFDTSVLVAACVQSHPHYTQAHPALLRITSKQDRGFISQHSIAEVFAVLTRLPIQPRIHPVEATRILTGNILPHFEIMPLVHTDYLKAVQIMAQNGLIGAKIYDVLLVQTAISSGAERIYTFNVVDFRLLAPPDERGKVCAP